ncbi:hypothetical protein EO244_03750 [Ancylomarina salipaludis]|uniref:Uncharacterized protein n=1 Tax=Ancylomarina salipaludis TaxID=2501299 RepID=A0A4Q1JPB6_9BACT|nr:hypothetical protein [Ancylomarina salipaludis]RXQ96755.1 hypothetical protein EO244_03750 [Ancylomarina salipaludis]
MKNIIYLFVALFLFASCEHELENTPNTNKGTAVASFKLGEKAIIEKATFKDSSIDFSLDIVTRDHFTSAPVYISYNDGKAVEFDQITSTSSSISFDQGSIENVLGKLNIVDGDKFTFTVPYFVLNTTDTIRSTTVYTTIEKDENGVEKEVEITVDNTTSKVDGLPIFDQDLTYYVACLSEIEGTYTLKFTGIGGGGLDAPEPYTATIEDVVIERISPIEYSVSNCMGNLMKEYYSKYGGKTLTGNFFDICGTFMPATPVNNGWHSNTYTNGVISPDGVITVDVKNNWGDSGTLVYTPKK